MKQKALIIILIISLNSNLLKGQIFNRDSLDSILLDDRIEKLLEGKSKIDAVLNLIDYIRNPNTVNEIWYSESSLDSLWYIRSSFSKDLLCTSLKLKSLFWIHLICCDQLEKATKIAKIENIKTGKAVFDYYLKEEKLNSIQSQDILNIKKYFHSWEYTVKNKGLQYVILKKISPLHNKYKFTIYQ
jgi:hypothetical protein